jgi:hypothetical protein
MSQLVTPTINSIVENATTKKSYDIASKYIYHILLKKSEFKKSIEDKKLVIDNFSFECAVFDTSFGEKEISRLNIFITDTTQKNDHLETISIEYNRYNKKFKLPVDEDNRTSQPFKKVIISVEKKIKDLYEKYNPYNYEICKAHSKMMQYVRYDTISTGFFKSYEDWKQIIENKPPGNYYTDAQLTKFVEDTMVYIRQQCAELVNYSGYSIHHVNTFGSK